MERKFFTAPALFVCVLIIALAAAFILFNKKNAGTAEVYEGDRLICSLSLDTDTVYEIKDKMKITVKDGCAFVSESSCPCKTCQSFGKLKNAGDIAVCLPQKIIIKLAGESDWDATL